MPNDGDRLRENRCSTSIADLSAWRIERWKAKRRRQVAAGTVNRELTLLKAVLTKGVTWKLLDRSPGSDVRYLPENNARLRYLATDDIERLLSAARADVARWLEPAIIFAIHTGLRQGELLNLRWRDLDFTVGLLTVQLAKNNEKRHIPLNRDVRAVVDALPRYGEWVLAWPWGDRVSDTTLYAAFGRTCHAAGITDFRWHDLRHTFASHLVMAGVDLRTVQELLGHKSLEMTMRYSHLAPAHKAAAVRSSRRRSTSHRRPLDALYARLGAVPRSRERRHRPPTWNVPGPFFRAARRPPSGSTCKVSGLQDGGGGNRTPVRKSFPERFYVRIR